MLCPQCGNTQPDDLKFCKTCGANLHALRRVMATREEQDEKFDWSKTWVAEMFMSAEEQVRRKEALDRLQGKTPEVRRRNEIKAGIITASVGFGLMVVLFAIMGGIIASGRVSDAAAEILSRLWIAGIIPVMVGLALIFNGIFVSRPGATDAAAEPEPEPFQVGTQEAVGYVAPADTNELFPAGFSVTDETTKHLEQPRKN